VTQMHLHGVLSEMKSSRLLLFSAFFLVACGESTTDAPIATIPSDGNQSMEPTFVLDHDAALITGETESLNKYLGNVVLIVNVASNCGYTGQYEQLEAIYKRHKGDGLVVLGFPANNFGSQEPGTDEEILEFCSSTYDVTFPMYSKINVKGEDVHPLYKDLAGQSGPIGGEPKWNFTKFLVNRQGQVVNRFETRISPDDDIVTSAIADLL
jgi:glutathione peroxidase